MRTLDEAIDHYEWCALESLGECSDEARQMADWLRELKRLHDIDIENNNALRIWRGSVERCAKTVDLLNEVYDGYIDMIDTYEWYREATIYAYLPQYVPTGAVERLGDECDELRNKYADRVNKANEDASEQKNGFESMLQRQAETIFGMRYIIERMLPILKAPGFDCYACPVEERCDVEHDGKCLLVEWARDMGIEADVECDA